MFSPEKKGKQLLNCDKWLFISRISERMQTLAKKDLLEKKKKKGLVIFNFKQTQPGTGPCSLLPPSTTSMIPSMAELNPLKIVSATTFTNVRCEKKISFFRSAALPFSEQSFMLAQHVLLEDLLQVSKFHQFHHFRLWC